MELAGKLEQKNLTYAKKGIVWALIGGMLYGVTPLLQTLGMEVEPLRSGAGLGILVVPFVMGFIQDANAGIWVLLLNSKNGKVKEYGRVIKTKPGKLILLASFFGGTVAMASFMTSVYLAGPVYPVALSATFPAIGAVLSRIFLKEKISPRGWLGIVLCVAGAVTISWVAPSGEAYPMFYLGMVFGLVAAFGWALEGIISCAGMDFVDPEVALGIRQFASAVLFLVALPLVGGLGAFKLLAATVPTMGFVYLALAGLAAGVAYFYYYKANNACGAARGMALNITYTLVSAVLSVLFLGSAITANFVAGIAVLLLGALLVAGKPSELFSLRDVN